MAQQRTTLSALPRTRAYTEFRAIVGSSAGDRERANVTIRPAKSPTDSRVETGNTEDAGAVNQNSRENWEEEKY